MNAGGVFPDLLNDTGAVGSRSRMCSAPPVWIADETHGVVHHLLAKGILHFFRLRNGISHHRVARHVGVAFFFTVSDLNPAASRSGEKIIRLSLVDPAQDLRIRIRSAADPEGYPCLRGA